MALGCLMAISVSLRGKQAVLDASGAVDILCVRPIQLTAVTSRALINSPISWSFCSQTLATDSDTPMAIRNNAIGTIRYVRFGFVALRWSDRSSLSAVSACRPAMLQRTRQDCKLVAPDSSHSEPLAAPAGAFASL